MMFKECQHPNEGQIEMSQTGILMVYRSGRWYDLELDKRLQKMQKLYPTATPYTNGYFDKEKMLRQYNL
jgi:hypothetical protein